MKNIITTICILIMLTFFNSCKKDKTYDTFSDVPLAKAAFDDSLRGVYKGVMLGSSGTIVIEVGNDGVDRLSAVCTIDGVKLFFDAVDLRINSITNGNIMTIKFRDSNSSSFAFVTKMLGDSFVSETVTDVNIVGHPGAKFIVAKEFSYSIIRCYEGSYVGGDNGLINGITYGNQIEALFISSNDPNKTKFEASGNVVNNNFSIGGTSTGTRFEGVSSGNKITGTWSNTNFNINGTFTAIRTL